MAVVEVAAAVIQRADGAFLLARRPAGKVYAGYWEFPGGRWRRAKLPTGPSRASCTRSSASTLAPRFPWITRVYTYPHATVRLNFFRVTEWRGEPHPREDQAIAWQRIGAAVVEPMLPANAPVLAALALPHEYAITDARAWARKRCWQEPASGSMAAFGCCR